jgi:hypothetical protein
VTNDKSVAVEYAEIAKLAQAITSSELGSIPLEKHETIQDRYEMHRIDMLTMYEARYGDKNYEMAWKALRTAMDGEQNKEALKVMKLLEIDFHVGEVAEQVKSGSGKTALKLSTTLDRKIPPVSGQAWT